MMKKILFLTMMAFLAIQFLPAKGLVTKDEKLLPEAARTFIKQHFTSSQISYIKIEDEFLKGKTYEAVLTNGVEIEFNNKGEWVDVDCKQAAVPMALVPDYVKAYVDTNFRENFITQIERGRRGIEVELNNDLSLKFDKDGKLSKLDD